MTRQFYHATDTVFDKFDPALQATKGASNGFLGVWVGNDRSECEMFGDVLMTLSLDKDVCPYQMKLQELLKLHQKTVGLSVDETRPYWKAIVQELTDEGYNVIDLHEANGVCHSILLDLDSIVVESHEMTGRMSGWGH